MNQSFLRKLFAHKLRITYFILFVLYTNFVIYSFNPRINYYRSQIEDSTIVNSVRIEYYDSLLLSNPSDRASLLYRKGITQRLNGDSEGALSSFRQAYACGPMLSEQPRLETLYSISQILNDLGKPIDAIKEVSRLMALPKPDSLRFYDVKAWMTVYNIQMILGNKQGALKALLSGLKELESVKDFTEERNYQKIYGVFLIMKGSVNTWLEKSQEAFENYKEAGKLLDHEHQGILNMSIGVLYSNQHEHDIALGYYQKALEDKWIDNRNRSAAFLNYLVGLVDLKRYADALDAVNKDEDKLSFFYGTPEEYKIWSIISEAYEGTRDWQKAFEYRKKAFAVKDSLLSEDVRYEVGNAMLEIEEVSSQKLHGGILFRDSYKYKNVWFLCVSGVAILLIIVSIMLILRYYRQKHHIKVLHDRLDISEKELKRLSSVEDEKKQLSQELSVCKARLSHISESLDDLRKLAANPRTYKSDIVNAVEKATRSVSADSQVWEPFMSYAGGASQEFFDKLYRLHPDLSNSETRMCAFILLGRTTKEIAAILNRSPRTVESIKYTLRVKLRIKDMTTEQYLRKISSTPLSELVTP